MSEGARLRAPGAGVPKASVCGEGRPAPRRRPWRWTRGRVFPGRLGSAALRRLATAEQRVLRLLLPLLLEAQHVDRRLHVLQPPQQRLQERARAGGGGQGTCGRRRKERETQGRRGGRARAARPHRVLRVNLLPLLSAVDVVQPAAGGRRRGDLGQSRAARLRRLLAREDLAELVEQDRVLVPARRRRPGPQHSTTAGDQSRPWVCRARVRASRRACACSGAHMICALRSSSRRAPLEFPLGGRRGSRESIEHLISRNLCRWMSAFLCRGGHTEAISEGWDRVVKRDHIPQLRESNMLLGRAGCLQYGSFADAIGCPHATRLARLRNKKHKIGVCRCVLHLPTPAQARSTRLWPRVLLCALVLLWRAFAAGTRSPSLLG